jgi:hypothetical protein
MQSIRVQNSYLWTYDLYGPCVIFLMRADPLGGQVGGGWALDIEIFWGIWAFGGTPGYRDLSCKS